ncbi:MAG: EamA family transporter [Bacteroidales bacterium]|nr:EamA family transporter [Bacteroidales bacterium]MBN2755568.1 EamA family transporter [Bacteroidales bacterium]
MRNFFSKKLYSQVRADSVSFTRFFFGFPIGLIALVFIVLNGLTIHVVSSEFYIWVFVFASMQLVATGLLVSLFKFKNFAISLSYAKTETIFVAILGFFILSEKISFLAIIGIIVSFIGIMTASLSKFEAKNILKSLNQKSTYIGLLTGLLFAIAVVSIKLSYNFIETNSNVNKSIIVLIISLSIQIVFMLPYMIFKRRNDLKFILKNPKVPILIGVFSSLGSFFWFFAFSLTSLAYVRTFGQLEFIISLIITIKYFKENISKIEIIGMILLIFGILILLYA